MITVCDQSPLIIRGVFALQDAERRPGAITGYVVARASVGSLQVSCFAIGLTCRRSILDLQRPHNRSLQRLPGQTWGARETPE